jgi:PAS domain S-box-containing protein
MPKYSLATLPAKGGFAVQPANVQAEPLFCDEPLQGRARQALALFEGIDDAVFVHDLEGHILDANPAACRRLGYSREELLHLTTRDIDAPSFAAGFHQRLREQLAYGRLSCEGCHVTRSGRLIPVDINASVIHIEGKPAVLAVMRDISERKLAEQRVAVQYAVTRVLAEADTLADATPKLLRTIGECMGCEMGALWRVDRAAQVIRCVDFWGNPEYPAPRFEALTRQGAFPRGRGLPGMVWAKGEPLWITDLLTDPNVPRASTAVEEGFHSGGGFPIRSGGDTTGMIEFFSRQARSPDGHLLSLIAALGSQIGQFMERKRAEEEGLRLARTLRLLLQSTGEGIYGTDLQGRCTFINKSAARMTGYAPKEVLGKNMHELLHHSRPDGSPFPLSQCPVCQSFPAGKSCRVEDGVIWRKGRTFFPAEYTSYPVIEAGVIRGAVVRFTDITERQRAGEEIKEMNALLDSMVENIPDMLFVKDATTLCFERINKTAESLLGYRREDLLGKSDYDFFPKEQADFFTAKDREVLRSKQLLEITEEIQTKEGPKIVHTRKLPIVDENGTPRHLLGISEDITARIALEETRKRYADAQERNARELEAKNQALGESERRYRQLIEASLDGIIVTDRQGRILLFNPAAEQLFGYSAGEAAGRPLDELIPQGLPEAQPDQEPQVLGRSVELQGRHKDGTEFPLELSLRSLDVGGAVQFLAAIRDLTERNRMRIIMVQTEKLASIGLLSAGVAHEINNPLAYVANNLVVLARDTKGLLSLLAHYQGLEDRLAQVDPEGVRQAWTLAQQMDLPYVRDNLARILAKTREGVQRVAKIVQSLRGLARTDRPQLEEVAISDLVDASVEMIRGRMQRRGVRLDLDYSAPGKLRCVATQVGQVVLNLLVNALQAIEAADRPDGRIRLSTRRVGPEVLIEVADTGCGIEPQNLPRLFDPFFTTKPVGEGTGLGLSISHGIVTGHGGRIDVDSKVGEGSRFRVFLPLHPSARLP